MRDGPGNGLTFIVKSNVHLYLTPVDPYYSTAVYKMTGIKTLLGEIVFVFSHAIERKINAAP